MSNVPFRFDPRRRGLRKFLGDTEYDIMEVLWKGEDYTVRDVCRQLRRRREIAYTTVMTVMSRLFDKGLLGRRKRAKAYVYRAAMSRERLIQSIVGRVIEGLMSDFAAPTMSKFVDSVQRQDPEKMDELGRLIEEKRRKDDA